MTVTIARCPSRVHGPLYWKGIKSHDQADVTLTPRKAATWPDEAAALAAVAELAPDLAGMGYRVVEAGPGIEPELPGYEPSEITRPSRQREESSRDA